MSKGKKVKIVIEGIIYCLLCRFKDAAGIDRKTVNKRRDQ